MTYIIEAQLKDGSYLQNIKNPLTSNLAVAFFRANELLKLPNVISCNICTTTDIMVEKFFKTKNLKK